VTPEECTRVLGTVRSEHARTVAQIKALERAVASIVDGSELTATDDEHDPEGATIAYERAQGMALLRQARLDLDRLADARTRLETGASVVCGRCGRGIDIERLTALPTARTCIHCAT